MFVALGLVCLIAARAPAARAAAPSVEKYLDAGKLAEGERALLTQVRDHPRDDASRFGLGTVQFLRAVEHMGRSLYRYGLRSDRGRRMNVPFLRLPVPENPKPEPVTYADIRRTLQDLVADLEKAEATLAEVKDEQVKLPLHLGRVRLDFTGDGKSPDPLVKVVAIFFGGPAAFAGNPDLLVHFDRGDVAWLRGYCHLLLSFAEAALAYDAHELFNATAHVFFAKPRTPYPFLTKPAHVIWNTGDGLDLIDLIAVIHLTRFPVKEPARMKAALGHLEQMLALSRESWQNILAETDDDHEWLPNPKQKGALGIAVTADMVKAWLEFVDEAEALLAGKRLVPFWRDAGGRGVNLRRVFTQPRRFDLVLWYQGSDAAPYLEKGELTRPEVWQRLQRVFRGEFIGFAIWFN
jgi:hypothetical protein